MPLACVCGGDLLPGRGPAKQTRLLVFRGIRRLLCLVNQPHSLTKKTGEGDLIDQGRDEAQRLFSADAHLFCCV